MDPDDFDYLGTMYNVHCTLYNVMIYLLPRYEDRTLARGGQGGQQQQNNSHATNGAAAYSVTFVTLNIS